MSRLAPVAVLVALCPALAQAAEWWKSEDGSSSVDVRAFYKVMGTGVRLSDGFVDVTRSLDRALDEARPLLPPDVAASLPADLKMPDVGALNGHVARFEAKVTRGELLQLDAAYQLSAAIASDPAFSGGTSLSGVFSTGTAAASRRLTDLHPVLLSRPGLRLEQNLDRLSVRLAMPFADLVIGRQVLSWGTGRLWNPTDLLSPFAPTEIDREVRRGVDALRASIPLARAAQLELVWLPQRKWEDNGGAVRAQANAFGYDFSVSMAKYASDVVAGADFSGDLGPLGFHGEAAFTWGLRGLGSQTVDVGERALRAVIGADWRPLEKLAVTAEYYFNGWGAQDASGYAQALASPRVQRGEVFGAGRHYLGAVASYQATDLLTVQLVTLVNLQDPSAQLMPVLEYWFEQSVIVRAGALIPLGAPPDAGRFQALTGRDVLTRSPAWTDATQTLGIQSEYGMTSFGLFGQVGLYFQ